MEQGLRSPRLQRSDHGEAAAGRRRLGRRRRTLQRGALDGAAGPGLRRGPVAHQSLHRRNFRRRHPHQRRFRALRLPGVHRHGGSGGKGAPGRRRFPRCRRGSDRGLHQRILRHGRRADAGGRFRMEPAGRPRGVRRRRGGRGGVHPPTDRDAGGARSGGTPWACATTSRAAPFTPWTSCTTAGSPTRRVSRVR